MFLQRYGTEAACTVALQQARWPQGFVCPRCAGTAHSCFTRNGESLWRCSAGRHGPRPPGQTSLLADTLFAYTRLPLTTWFLALYVLTQTKNNVSALELKRHLGVCYGPRPPGRTAWRLKHKLMQAMTHREEGRKLAGFVQIDRVASGHDAYLGGERNGGKAGRGSENKRPFLIAVETDERGFPGCAVIEPVSGFTKAALAAWLAQHLHPEAELFSDGLGAFRAAVDLGHAHTVIDAGGGRAATESPGARWVNIVLSNLKRALDGTYHVFSFFKYAHRYLAEAAWRFNRRFQLDALVPRLLVAAARCPTWTERRLRDVPIFAS